MEELISPNYTHEKLQNSSIPDLIDVFEDLWCGYIFEPVRSLIDSPHGSVAAMSVLCSYYEAIESLYTGQPSRNRSREFFVKGFSRVFSSSEGMDAAANEVYIHVRCKLANKAFSGIYSVYNLILYRLMRLITVLFTIFSLLFFRATDEAMALYSFLYGFGPYLLLAGFFLHKARFPALNTPQLVSSCLVLCGAILCMHVFFLPTYETRGLSYSLLSGSVLIACAAVCLSFVFWLISSFNSKDTQGQDSSFSNDTEDDDELRKDLLFGSVHDVKDYKGDMSYDPHYGFYHEKWM